MHDNFKNIVDANPLIGVEEYLAVRVLRAFDMNGDKRANAARAILTTAGFMIGPGQWGVASVLLKTALRMEPYQLSMPELLTVHEKKANTVPKLLDVVRTHPFMVPPPDPLATPNKLHSTVLLIRTPSSDDENFVAMTMTKAGNALYLDDMSPVMAARFYPRKSNALILFWRMTDFMKTLQVDNVKATLFT